MISRQCGSLRLDAIGDVARPFTAYQFHTAIVPLATAVFARRLPMIALLNPILASLSAGARRRRSERAMMNIGEIGNALALFVVFDAADVAHCRQLHDALRALDAVSIDALEDMLSLFPAAAPLLEAERMHRAGMLKTDWALRVLPERAPNGRIAATISVHLREPEAQA